MSTSTRVQEAEQRLATARANVDAVSGVGPRDPNMPLGQIVNRTARQRAQAGARLDRSIERTAAAFRELESAERELRVEQARASAATRNAETLKGVTPETIKVAKFVRTKYGWHQVQKANAKSVTVPSMVGGSWTDRIPHSKILEVR